MSKHYKEKITEWHINCAHFKETDFFNQMAAELVKDLIKEGFAKCEYIPSLNQKDMVISRITIRVGNRYMVNPPRPSPLPPPGSA